MVLSKLACDQLLFAPVATALLFVFLKITEGGTPVEAAAFCAENWWRTLKVSFFFFSFSGFSFSLSLFFETALTFFPFSIILLFQANWMLWPAANLIAFAAIPQVKRRKKKKKKKQKRRVFFAFIFFANLFSFPFFPPSTPPQQDLRILYSNTIGVAWCAYVSLSVAAAAAGGGSLPPPPPPFDSKLE